MFNARGNEMATTTEAINWRDEYDAQTKRLSAALEDRRKLVEALRAVVDAYTVTDGIAGKNPAERAMIREQGRALLRELKEITTKEPA